ncbi:MAG: rRNA pseudouridine synthase [Gammaproteobacteria bacterium]|nr:rRNA pseudouridine synthase [Gammaproteobacteria bacterium]
MKRRLDQILSSYGYCSRKEAKAWCRDGRVACAGESVRDPAAKLEPRELLIDGEPIDHPDGILVVLHKPVGYVCSHDPAEGERIYDLLPIDWQARDPQPVSVGRLDRDTSGLILVTDQSMLVHRLTSPKHKVPKTYEVLVDKPLSAELIPAFAAGTLMLDGEKEACRPAELRITGERTAELVLMEGKYHQVRRMFAALGYHVQTLHRSRFAELSLEGLEEGEFRDLGAADLAALGL